MSYVTLYLLLCNGVNIYHIIFVCSFYTNRMQVCPKLLNEIERVKPVLLLLLAQMLLEVYSALATQVREGLTRYE